MAMIRDSQEQLLASERKLGNGFLDATTASLEITGEALKTRLQSGLACSNTRLDRLGTLDSINKSALVVVELAALKGQFRIDLLNATTAGLERLANTLSTWAKSLFAVRDTGSYSLTTFDCVSDGALVILKSLVQEYSLDGYGSGVTLDLRIQLRDTGTARLVIASETLSTGRKTLFALSDTSIDAFSTRCGCGKIALLCHGGNKETGRKNKNFHFFLDGLLECLFMCNRLCM